MHHASDSFLVLTTDGINFMVNSQEICDFVSVCHDPVEAAHNVTEQVDVSSLPKQCSSYTIGRVMGVLSYSPGYQVVQESLPGLNGSE